MKSTPLLTFLVLAAGALAEPILMERQESSTVIDPANPTGSLISGAPGGQPGSGNAIPPKDNIGPTGTDSESSATATEDSAASTSSGSFADHHDVPMFGLCAALAVAVFA